VKRFLVLLIVLAGGLAAAAFAVPTNAATVNGTAISQQRLNTDLDAIGNSPSYQCYLNAQELVGTQGQTGLPAFYGVGSESGSHPTVTTAYASTYLDTLVGHQLVFDLADQKNLQVTSQDLTAAHAELVAQITTTLQEVASTQYQCTVDGQPATAATVLATMPDSFVNQNVQFDATVTALEENEAGISTAADLEGFYNAHASEFDTACFTVAEYSSQADAEAAAATVAAGTPFETVAAQAGGGPQRPCSILYGIASMLPAGSNLQSLPVNQVSSPIALSSTEYALVQITERTPTSFAKAEPEVRAAVQAAGATKARAVVNAAEKNASVAVDQRYGNWEATQAVIVPPPSPQPSDLLNSAANIPPTTPTSSPGAASNGSTSSGTSTTPSGQTP
jgi:hypothetical protein